MEDAGHAVGQLCTNRRKEESWKNPVTGCSSPIAVCLS